MTQRRTKINGNSIPNRTIGQCRNLFVYRNPKRRFIFTAISSVKRHISPHSRGDRWTSKSRTGFEETKTMRIKPQNISAKRTTIFVLYGQPMLATWPVCAGCYSGRLAALAGDAES